MSGLKQELGLGQGVGLLSTSLLGTGVFAVPALAALVAGDNSLWAWPLLILLVFPIAIVFALLGRHFPSAGGVAHFVDMAFGPRLASVTGWLFLSVIPVGLPAALHIAIEMEKEGLISKEEAVMCVEPEQLDQLLHPQFDKNAEYDVLARGLNASPGAAVGEAVFSAADAVAVAEAGRKCVLVRWETNPDDLAGMIAAEGILTSHGGKTSHAAVIARGMGAPCVCGVEALKIDAEKKQAVVSGTDVVIKEGDMISIDGTTGSVVLGGCPTTRTLGPAQVDAAARGVIRGIHPGTGDARYTIVDEWEANPNNKHVLGSLCMAHKSDPNSGSCQFYFSLSEQPEFDDKFTVFGQTVEGLDVVQKLTIGDAIVHIGIEGADEEALAEAISHELPRPKTPKEVLEELDREREERRKQAEADAAAGEEE